MKATGSWEMLTAIRAMSSGVTCSLVYGGGRGMKMTVESAWLIW